MSRGRIVPASLAVLIAVASIAEAQRPAKLAADPVVEQIKARLERAISAYDRADFDAALAEAEAASARADRALPKESNLRRTASVLVKLARSGKAVKALDLEAAKSESDAAVAMARPLPVKSMTRLLALVASAELHLSALKDPQAALALYEEAAPTLAATEKPGDIERVGCAVLTAFLRAEAGKPDREAARHIAEAIGPLAPGRADVVLRPVAGQLWNLVVGRALDKPAPDRNAVEAAEQGLRGDLGRVSAVLRQAGAGDGLLGWGDFYLLKFQHDRERFGAAEITLIALQEKIGGSPPADFLAEHLSYTGALATRRGDYVAAREAHEAERKIRTDAKLPGMHRTLNSLGRVLLRVGDFRAASEALEKAATLCAADPLLKADPIRPVVLTQLGQAMEGSGSPKEAGRLHLDAVALAEKATRRDDSTIAMCRNNLGVNRYATGDLDAASAEFRKARAIAAKAFGDPSLNVAEVDVNLGWVARAGGDSADAEARFRAALKAIISEDRDSRRRAEVLGYLASILGESGRLDEARKAIDEAIALREAALRRELLSSYSERERLAIAQELRFHPESRAWPGVLDAFLDLAPTLKVEPEAQYARVLAWKGAVGRGAIAGPSSLEPDPEVRKLFADRESVLKSLRAEAAESPSKADRARHEERLIGFEATADDLERQLRRKSKTYAASGAAADAKPSDVVAAVPEGWALVDVIEVRRPGVVVQKGKPLRENRRYVAFVVREGTPITRLDLGDAEPIDSAIRTLLRALNAPTESYIAPSQKLAALVRDPLTPYLGGVEGLILAGDGMLHRIPLAALPGAKPGTFWVEDLAFATVPTAQSLIARRAERPKTTGALIVGDVEYDSFAQLPPLPKTKEEAEGVATAFRSRYPGEPVDLFEKRDATEPAIRSRIGSRRLVHLATHGFFPGETDAGSTSEALGAMARLDSGIVLARGKPGRSTDPDDDQKLTADELVRVDLRGVELVVLSACSSGLGHISAGQGVVGLVGALDRAGVRAVACSLWKVNDSATAKLMAGFYRHRWGDDAKSGPASALRSAQRDMIRGEAGGAKPFAHPHYWAAFFISGDPLP